MTNIEYKLNLIDGTINYVNILDPNIKLQLAQEYMTKDGEDLNIATNEERVSIDPILSKLSVRNFKNVYIVPTEQLNTLINFIPKKTAITDTDINKIISNQFEYFLDEVDILDVESTYSMADGLFFRYADEIVKPIDQYTYYIMDDGVINQIPNYKTLEVMLFERGQNYNSVRIIERTQFNEIAKNTQIVPANDKSSQWKLEMEDQVNFGKYLNLMADAKSAGAQASAAAAEADKSIKALEAAKKAAEAASKAAEAKAKAEEEKAAAAKKASEAEIEKAKADQASAKAAEAEAKAKEAEAEAKKQEYESKST